MSLTAIVHMVVWHQSSSQANGGEQPSAAATPKSQKNLWRQWQHSLRGCMCERCSHRAVLALRYSQESCQRYFQCGRTVDDLVRDLLDQKVSLKDRFLRLTVFESTDSKTHEPILRCIDNRRLLALKEFAARIHPEPVLVHVNFFTENELREALRCVQNLDHDTDGKHVRVRKGSRRPFFKPRRRRHRH